MKPTIEPVAWNNGSLRLLDQTRLPQEEAYLDVDDYRDVATAIRKLRVRGAPLIGIAAAYGLVLAARAANAGSVDELLPLLRTAAEELAATRPTAVNLRWALEQVLAAAQGAATPQEAQERLLAAAQRLHREDAAASERIGRYGAGLLTPGSAVLTHCNTGSLAAGGIGTALGVIRTAWADGKLSRVYVTETRPLLQGSRLTMWELARDGIPATLIADGAAGLLMRRGQITAVIVGADRIAANGDVANKVGTYPLAVLARENGVRFYVAAPTSTIDLSTVSGEDIPIEERPAGEVTAFAGRSVAPDGVEVANPAFDVTPHRCVTAIVTENGVAAEPYLDSLARASRAGVAARG
ncbi:MAG: S-methyl-5-thioribose-1-phosphate isomerase [Chloroflexi bacterium]|nr:S-methyl-5-thioribose-1-phosphate isomerase [Chloroflexota bacterium]